MYSAPAAASLIYTCLGDAARHIPGHIRFASQHWHSCLVLVLFWRIMPNSIYYESKKESDNGGEKDADVQVIPFGDGTVDFAETAQLRQV